MDVKARALNSVVGVLVADAASMGLHWIYDVEKLDTLAAQNTAAEGLFHTPPAYAFYDDVKHPGHYASGQQSPYGEQFIATLTALAGSRSTDSLGEDLAVGLGSWVSSFTGRPNGGLKDFKAKVEGGAVYPHTGGDDKQADAFYTAAAATALHAGKADVLAHVATAVRVVHDNDISVAAASATALILDAVLTGASLPAALEKAAAEAPELVRPHFAAARTSAAEGQALRTFLLTLGPIHTPKDKHGDFTPKMGLACPYPYSLLGALHVLYTEAKEADHSGAFVRATRINSLAGGDNCGRAAAFAAVLAVLDPVPAELVEKTREVPSVTALLEKAL